MRLLKYVIQSFLQGHQKHILFNTLNRSIVAVNRDLLDCILAEPSEDQVAQNQELEMLRTTGFLVPSDFDDAHYARFWFNKYKYDTSTLDVTLLTTYKCQFACRYCCQSETGTGDDLSVKNAATIAQRVLEICKASSPSTVLIGFFGGEPLLNINAIRTFISTVREHGERFSKRFHYSIVTNAFALNESRLDWLIDNGLQLAQITLDGTPQVHNFRRPLRNGRPTFTRIYENIKKVSQRMPLIVGINVDSHNINNIYSLIDKMSKDNLQKNVLLNIGQIINCGNFYPFDNVNLKAEILCHIFDLQAFAVLKGFRCRDYLDLGLCPANLAYSLVIDPNGDIYRCITSVGRPEFRTANILSDSWRVIAMRDSQFVGEAPWETEATCRDCEYLPLCWGGCRHDSFMTFGDMRQIYCNKTAFKKVCSALVEHELVRHHTERR